MTALRLTIDFEDPSFVYEPEGRYVAMTRRVLDFCDAHNAKATFFTVGRIASAAPDLVRDIAARGHEIGYHSHTHLPLTQEHPEIFFREAYVDKDRLEQITGTPVLGFRAPCYSLTPQTLWAAEKLQKLGFLYSSSLMPTSISRFGMKKAPQSPFRWPCGMIEFPLPVHKLGPLKIPYLGGIYLYAMPFQTVKKWISQTSSDEVLWTYAHPYDFDREESFHGMPETPLWVSLILWLARRRATPQIERLLVATDRSLPLGYLASDKTYVEKLPTFTPENKA